MSRPMLLPGVAVLWRGPHTLQLGLDPRRAVVFDLPNPAAAGLLELLDGGRTEEGVIAAAGRRGIGEADARALLDALRRQALVVGARTLLPSSLAGPARERMIAEAAALALRDSEPPGSGPVGAFARPPDAYALPSGALAQASALPPPGALAQPPGPANNSALSAPPARLSGAAAARAVIPITPAQILRRRAAARIRVVGRSRLGIPIAVALAAAGVGHVDPALDGTVERGELILAGPGLTGPGLTDPGLAGQGFAGPGRPGTPDGPATGHTHSVDRAGAAKAAILTAAPGVRVTPLQRRDTTFLVQVGPPTRPAALHSLAYRGVAQLTAGVRDGTAVIGPLVPPGCGPCVNCVDLHRTDRDPVWPALAAQLATSPGVEACGVAALLTAVGYAVGEILRVLDGATPDLIGSTIEVSGPGRIRRRTWRPHPDCDCTRHR